MKMLSKKSGCYFKQLPFAGLSGGMGAVLLTIKNKLTRSGLFRTLQSRLGEQNEKVSVSYLLFCGAVFRGTYPCLSSDNRSSDNRFLDGITVCDRLVNRAYRWDPGCQSLR